MCRIGRSSPRGTRRFSLKRHSLEAWESQKSEGIVSATAQRLRANCSPEPATDCRRKASTASFSLATISSRASLSTALARFSRASRPDTVVRTLSSCLRVVNP